MAQTPSQLSATDAVAEPESRPADSDVVVVGGGLAGLTAALDLAEAGVRTTLIERRPYVGGKTFSFQDHEANVELDNGQHIYLRCCTAYRALIERLGLQEQVRLQSRLRLPVLDPASGKCAAIESWPAWLPPPLNLAASIARLPHISWREKLLLGRAILPIWRMGAKGRRRLDDVSFGDWLLQHGQSQRVIDRFWDLIVLPICNDRCAAVSAQQAIMVFQVGLLADAHAADIGVATVGLSHIADRALTCFREAGGRALLGVSVEAVDADGARATGVRLRHDERIPASAVLLALPPTQAVALLPADWRAQPGFAPLAAFEYAPIVNVHLHWDRSVMDDDFVVVLDPAVQYVFNRSRILGIEGRGQWLACSLSGAHAETALPQATLAEAAIAGIRRAFPRAQQAEVLHWRVVKETEATFRPRPGSAAQRVGAQTSVPNLLLAGAWTDTEWPATMESAVRSGHAAAAAYLKANR